MVKVRSRYGLGLAVRYEREFPKVCIIALCDATVLPSVIHTGVSMFPLSVQFMRPFAHLSRYR